MKNIANLSLHKTFILLFVVSIVFPIQNNAQFNEKNIELGKIITINSEVLSEEREIFIYLPVDYENTQNKYPVIYILDARRNFVFSVAVVNYLSNIQRMPRSIVVGIPNTDRTRDFTPSHVEDSRTSGGADNFLEFMDKELIPHVDKNYRTHTYKTLFGHSLCGMFAVYTLFENPEMFNSFISVSPFLEYDNQYVLNRVESILEEHTDFKKDLFVTLGNEPGYLESLERLEDLLSDKTENLTWEISHRESEDHGSVPLKSLYDGLEFIYSDWRLNDEVISNGLEAIKNYYKSLSDKYGYIVQPTEGRLNVIGYQYLGNNQNENAIEVFKYNAELYPNSANVYDSLGEALEKVGKYSKAIESYRAAVKLGAKNNDRNFNIYKQNLERIDLKN